MWGLTRSNPLGEGTSTPWYHMGPWGNYQFFHF
jgi:hypothetical protein